MSFQIRDGQIRKYRKSGKLASSVTSVVPEGQFLKSSGLGADEFVTLGDSTCPLVYLNLVASDRPDCTDGGIVVVGGEPYELETDVYDSTASFAVDAAVTVKTVGTSVGGIITLATTGDYIHGWVKEAPSSFNGTMLVVAMCATNDGKVSA